MGSPTPSDPDPVDAVDPVDPVTPTDAAPQFEVIPLPGIAEKVLAVLAPGSRVTVTASPAQGQDATLEVAGELARHGMQAIPHLAARMLGGAGDASEKAARVVEAGMSEVFVIAGDAKRPAGEFTGALELLEVLAAVAPDLTVGIGTHPEGHPFLDDAAAMDQLRAKAEHASYTVTQMCFDAVPLLAWTHRLREEGITLPLRPGIAAPVSIARLLRIGPRIGVGRSLRLLGDEGSGMRRLLGPGRWDPGPLLEQLISAGAQDPALALRGPHVYTFNDLQAARDALAPR